MKFLRLAVLLLTCSVFSFGASKEIIELQRDVALLQDKVDRMQRDLATKIDVLTGIVQSMQDTNNKTVAQLATLQDSVASGVSRSLAPVSGMGTKVDSMGDDVRSLKDALNDLSTRLERMDAKITDLKNQIQIAQNPPSAPGGATATGQPGQQTGPTGPPPGMSAAQSYTDAMRDMQAAKIDLAYQEFQQYLTYFPNTEQAANAQYYIGEIDYNRGDYNGAVQAFDAVLERYPDNPKTADAHLMKAMALLKQGQRNRAVQEFRVLVSNYPSTNDAKKARQELHDLGVSAATTTPTRRK